MKILVAEDCPYTRRIINLHLNKHGFTTVVCEDGQYALEELSKHDDIKLILSDIVMPRLNGLQLLQKVKSDDALKNIPFAIITGKNDTDTVKAAVQLGCGGYIVKPVIPGVMMDTVRSMLNLKEEWDIHGEKGIYTSRARLR